MQKKTHTQEEKTRIMSQNKILQDQVKKNSIKLKRTEWEENRILSDIKQELEFQEKLKTRLTIVKKELNSKKLAVLKSKSKLSSLKEDSQKIISELEKYESKVKPSLVEKSELIQNNFPKLISYIRHQKVETKYKTILLNSIQMMMEKTLDNEFSDIRWKAVLSHSDLAIGVRIKFLDLSMLKSDVKLMYTPVIDKLNRMFKDSGLILRTDYQMRHGIISELDFTFKIKTGQAKTSAILPRNIPSV